jgi:hypothetical protein
MPIIVFLILAVLVVLPARADPPPPQIKALMDTPPSKFDVLMLMLNTRLLEATVTTPYRFYGFYSTNPGGDDKIMIRVEPDKDEEPTRENCENAIGAARKALDVDPKTGESTVTGTTISTVFGSLGAPEVGDAAAFPDLIDSMSVVYAEVIKGDTSIACTGPLFSTTVDFPPPP